MSFNDIINTTNSINEKEFTLDPTNNLLYDFTKKEDINSFLNGKKSVFVVGITKGVDTIEELESDYNKLIESGKSPYIGRWGGNYDLVLTFNTEEEASKYDQDIILRIQGTEFVEDEHPRDGDGKFSDKGGGSSDKKDTDISRSLSTRMGRGSMDMGSHRIIEQYNKDNPDSQVKIPQVVNDLWQPMEEYDSMEAVDNFNEKHKEWKSWLDDNPQVKKVFDDMQVEVDEYNKILDDKFKNAKSFFRGSGLGEFNMISSQGMLDESDKYSFQSFSMNESDVGFDSGVVIEYDADFIKDLGGVKTEYTTDIVPTMDFNTDEFMDKGEDIERVDSKVNSLFADEQEVRIDNGDSQLEGLNEKSMKSVTFNFGKLSLEKFLDRYLGNANVDVQRSTPKQLINSQKGWIGSQDSWVEQNWDEVIGIMKQVNEQREDDTWMKDVEFKYTFKGNDGLFADNKIIESFVEDEHPRDGDGKFASGGNYESVLQKRGLSGDDMLNQLDKLDVFKNADSKINDDATVTVYHHTKKDIKDLVYKTGGMKGAEDGVFFTTKKDGEAITFGDNIISANIPIEMLDIDDDFGDELHLRIPTDKIGQIVDVSKFLNTEAFVEDEHPRDGGGKFSTKNGEDQSKTTRDITINNQLEYYEGIVEEYNEKIENTKKELEAEDNAMAEYKNTQPKGTNPRSMKQMQLRDMLYDQEIFAKETEELIKILNEKSSLINELDLFSIIKGKDTHKVEYKGLKNAVATTKFTKKWNLNIDGKVGIMNEKKIYFVDPKTGKPNKKMPHINQQKGITEEQFDKETGGKQLLFTNVNNGVTTPDWAREDMKEFTNIWNNILTDEERSSVDVVNVKWTTKEQLIAERKGKKKGYALGSVMARATWDDEGDGSDLMEHPSVLTINLLKGQNNIDYLNTVIHEMRHGVWNMKVEDNEEKLNKFTDKILEGGREKAISWYVREKYDELEKMKKDQEANLERIMKKDKHTVLNQSEYEKLFKEDFDAIKKEHIDNIRIMENIIANETHSDYFAIIGSPSKTHIKEFNAENLKNVSSLIKEIIYNED